MVEQEPRARRRQEVLVELEQLRLLRSSVAPRFSRRARLERLQRLRRLLV